MPANLPKTPPPRIVIVGGGFGGINLAKKLKNADAQVVMVDRNNFHNFQPLMYQVATAGLEVSSIAFPLRKLMRNAKNFYYRMTEVTAVDPKKNCIMTTIGSIEYDYLVIATGTRTNYFNMQDVEIHSMPLKSIAQSIGMRNYILQSFENLLLTDDPEEKQRLMTFVIAGAGPTGVEMAGALSELRKKVLPSDYPELDFSQMRIMIVDPGQRVLATMSEEASKKAKEFLEDFGVEILLGVGISSFDGKTAKLSNEQLVQTHNLIWAAGVTGDLIKGFDKELIVRGNRIKVDEYNRVPGYNNVFVIGDIAYLETKEFPKGLPGLAQVAIQQGKHLGKNLKRALNNEELKPFKYTDKGSLATIGRNHAVADLPWMKTQGFFAWVIWLFVHLLFLIGFRNKLAVFIDWFWNYISWDRRVRLIIKPFIKKEELQAETLEGKK